MIFLELVPKKYDQLINDAKWALSTFPEINAINIPDIFRLNNRSYEIVKKLSEHQIDAIPHIRITDYSETKLFELCSQLINHNISKVLLISGDIPPNTTKNRYNHSLPKMIKSIKKELPTLSVYAGCDPYRQSFQSEINYCQEKLAAGATGLFTQPIFNNLLASLLIEQCPGCEWFIGISPILTKKTFNYWASKNNVVFHPQFKLTLDYNIAIGKDIIKTCKEANQHNYIMPIKANIQIYLSELLNE